MDGRGGATGRIAIDDLDRRLIELLCADGRAALTGLGRAVGLSADAVRERLKRLEGNGVLRVLGSVDPAALGYHAFGLSLLRVNGPVAPVAAALAEVPEIDFVVCVGGRGDLLAEVVARDAGHLFELLDEHVRAHPAVVSCETFRYLGIGKWQPGGGFGPQRVPGPGDAAALDAHDRAIIGALSRDGRLSYRELAERTGVPYSIARRRSIRLLESGTVTVVTVVNRMASGERVQAAVGVRASGPLDRVLDEVRRIDEVEVAVATTGRYDLLLDVACPSERALTGLVTDRLRTLPGVTATEALEYLKIFKLPVNWAIPAH
ncbi:Lrp/AsnC family transcriptional regulator [Spirillospora sp. CA-294931]|uniref:Lrp/AsnC family transcriptional regulator n=1 Tax=Spirillospora sp. CA-294931 TaxID=3240042 RepID=UPI003D93197E